MGAARRKGTATILVALGLVTAGCGGAEGDVGTDGPAGTDETDRRDRGDAADGPASSPFRVDHMPDGYRLVQAGEGTQVQEWGSDSFGTDEPVTLLTPPGEAPGGPDDVVVTTTAYDGYQGGMAQAVSGYPSAEPEAFEVDGRPAMYLPDHEGDDGPVPADLVADIEDGHTVRVSAFDAGRDELVEIARAVEPPTVQVAAPEVPDPPGRLEVVGSADADVAMALGARPRPASDFLPVGSRGHVQVWAPGGASDPWNEAEAVTVATLPGSALDIEVLEVLEVALSREHGRWDDYEVTGIEVDGRPGVAVAPGAAPIDDARAAVISTTSGGDLVLVLDNGEALASEDLVTVAASVEAVDGDAWDELVLEARGGPGLHPDPGAIELERGTVGDVDWLFQARPDVNGMTVEAGTGAEGPGTEDVYEADPCLKLSTGERLCARSSGSVGPLTWSSLAPADSRAGDGPLSAFVVISTSIPEATRARLHLGGGVTEEAELHPLTEGGTRRAGIVVEPDTSDRVFVDCIEVDDTTEPGGVELLDGNGDRLPCR